MARTITEIQQSLLDKISLDTNLAPLLTSTSSVAIFRLFLYIVSFCAWTIENLHDFFKVEVAETIALMKPHSLRWYAEKSRAFQYGYPLVPETDGYDNTGIAEDVVAASKIVSYAAVVEKERGVRIKVAKTVGSDLDALNAAELASFTAYLVDIKDAGVKLQITSGPADSLYLALRIKYNPLVLNASGARIDGTVSAPVKDAIKQHLKVLPFNGIFSVQKLVDAIQAVEGVMDLSIDQVQTRYGLLPYSMVNISVIPDAGYLRIADADLLLTYSAY